MQDNMQVTIKQINNGLDCAHWMNNECESANHQLWSGAPTGFFSRWGIGGGRVSGWGGTMASAEHEPITGVWG